MSCASVRRRMMYSVGGTPPHCLLAAREDDADADAVDRTTGEIYFGSMIPISSVLSLPRLRMRAVKGIPLPLPLAPLLSRSASQILRYLKSCDGRCSRQRPTWLMRWTIRSSSPEYWEPEAEAASDGLVGGWSGRSAMAWISLMALSSVFVGSAVVGAAARIGAKSSLVLKMWSMASRPPSSFIFLGSMWISVRTSLMVQPSRFWYLVTRLATSIPVRE